MLNPPTLFQFFWYHLNMANENQEKLDGALIVSPSIENNLILAEKAFEFPVVFHDLATMLVQRTHCAIEIGSSESVIALSLAFLVPGVMNYTWYYTHCTGASILCFVHPALISFVAGFAFLATVRFYPQTNARKGSAVIVGLAASLVVPYIMLAILYSQNCMHLGMFPGYLYWIIPKMCAPAPLGPLLVIAVNGLNRNLVSLVRLEDEKDSYPQKL
jgi:hypothetical protein